MLELFIPEREFFNERTSEFVTSKAQTLKLEHSLLSISKWESKWHKPFLGRGEKTLEETIDYLKCMTINKDVDDLAYAYLTQEDILKVNAYIDDSMTATTINDRGAKKGPQRIVTSELLYAWMFQFQIPKECEKWHLNRLITLIRVMDIESQPKKKMGRKEQMRQNAALNAARKKKFNTRG